MTVQSGLCYQCMSVNGWKCSKWSWRPEKSCCIRPIYHFLRLCWKTDETFKPVYFTCSFPACLTSAVLLKEANKRTTSAQTFKIKLAGPFSLGAHHHSSRTSKGLCLGWAKYDCYLLESLSPQWRLEAPPRCRPACTHSSRFLSSSINIFNCCTSFCIYFCKPRDMAEAWHCRKHMGGFTAPSANACYITHEE